MLVAKTLTSTLLSSTSFTFGSVQASVLIGTAMALNVSRKSSFKEKNNNGLEERVINILAFHLEASSIPIAFLPI